MEKQTKIFKNDQLFGYLRSLLLLKDANVVDLITVEVRKEGDLVLINDIVVLEDDELEPIFFYLDDLDNTSYMVENEIEELTTDSFNPMNLNTGQLQELATDYTEQLEALRWERHQIALEIQDLMDRREIVLDSIAEKILDNSNKDKDSIH